MSRALLILLSCGCVGFVACFSVGQGEGAATGRIQFDQCRIADSAYDLRPTFFGAEYAENPLDVLGTYRVVTLRVQRGSFQENSSDGIIITIDDVNALARRWLGVPIDLSTPRTERLVGMTFYATETCTFGTGRRNRWLVPAIIEAVSGTITFDAVRAPEIAASGEEFSAHFDGVVFESRSLPETRRAELTGFFSFFYQRGGPAQLFP